MYTTTKGEEEDVMYDLLCKKWTIKEGAGMMICIPQRLLDKERRGTLIISLFCILF